MKDPPAALPDDLVLEVLARVADVPTLFRFATAAKHWRGLVRDRSFLRRRWPENSIHATFLAGFFTQRMCHKSEDNECPFIHKCVVDRDSPPVFIPAPRSMLGPVFRSLPSGVLDGAKPLTARRGLLLVRLAPILQHSLAIRLAVCDLLAGTCDELPPLQRDRNWAPQSYAILTGEDCPSRQKQPSSLAPNYSRFFKVLAIGFVCDAYRGGVEYTLRTFSSAETGWATRAERLEHHYGYPSIQDDAAVCCHGITHWLCGDSWSDNRSIFTISVSPEDGQKPKLSSLAYQPTAEVSHLATVDGTLTLFLLYTGIEDLWLHTWTWTDGTRWHRTRVTKLKQPEHRRIESVLYFWSGEKSGTVFIIDSKVQMYVVYLETATMEQVSSQFRGMVGDAVPVEVEWPDLFMSRLAGSLQ